MKTTYRELTMNRKRSRSACQHALKKALLLATTAFILPAVATAQEESDPLENIVVMGSRLPSDLSTVPGSFQVLTRDDISDYTNFSSDIGLLLEQAIPGMAPNQGDGSNFTNVIRGREPAYLIDGFPQTLPLRGGGRDMRIIDPSAIETIEVIRGATALYGQGGAGGYVNYITRTPEKGEWNFSSEVGLGTSLSHIDTDSFTYQARQLIMGGMDKWDILLSGFYEDVGIYYDGQGDAIPPDPFQQGGVSEADTKNFLGKVGFDFTEEQRLEVTMNYYKKSQKTDFVAGSTGVLGQIKAPRVPKTSPDATVFGNGPVDPFTKNIFAAVNYLHEDVMGSAVKVQGMFQDYDGAFPWNPRYVPNGDSSALVGKKYAGRIDVNTPLEFGNGFVLWGAEWTQDKTGQFGVVDGALIMPNIKLNSYAAFAQASISPTEWLSINGGLRYEDARLNIPDYQTVRQYINPNDPSAGFRSDNLPVEGGKLSYDELLFNLGVVVDVAEDMSVFAAYSQGFTVTDIGRVLRGFSGGSIFDRVNDTRPQITNNYEVGLRTSTDTFSGAIAFYYNESSLGSSWDPITLELTRDPERVWGVEVSGDVNLEKTRFGGTLGWANSEVDGDNDGVYESELNYWRVPPVKATGYFEYDFKPDWTARLQGLKVFSENRFPEIEPWTSSARSPIDGYFVLDASISGQAGPGTLTLGIKNILNKKYFAVLAQTSRRPDTYTMAQGATALLKYRIDY
jgi:iron complex outermembrane receptor protein